MACTGGLEAQVITLGRGCNGSGVSPALARNDQGPVLPAQAAAAAYAYPVVNTTAATVQVVGLQLFVVNYYQGDETSAS